MKEPNTLTFGKEKYQPRFLHMLNHLNRTGDNKDLYDSCTPGG